MTAAVWALRASTWPTACWPKLSLVAAADVDVVAAAVYVAGVAWIVW